jgi:hypothetical protein
MCLRFHQVAQLDHAKDLGSLSAEAVMKRDVLTLTQEESAV